MSIYYRSCGETPFGLYRVEATSVPAAPGGGLDLSKVPAGRVSGWDGSRWVAAELPPVGHESGQVCHTKNKAGVGVPAPVAAPAAAPTPPPLPRADKPARKK